MSDPIPRLNAALEGRYRIERELGEGGMATVYLAEDLKHERNVALKVLKPELAAVVGAERFLAEIKTTANLQHPHILPLFDSGEADGFLFYVMPYVDGETLRERLDRERELPVDEAVRIASDVAEALQAAHDQGVIHRDIKPANILLSKGRPLVSDFGIALAVTAAGGGRLTETGLSMGTPFYMSPEQASADREPTAAADVYSLGCVLYEMLVGDPPYVAGSAQAVLAKILTDRPPEPRRSRPSIPANVDAAIRRALEKLPADRFGSAAALARALADDQFQHRGASERAGAATVGPRHRLGIVGLLTFGLVAGFVAGRWVAWSDETARGPVRFAIPLIGEQRISPQQGINVTVAPDGSWIAFRGRTQLWRRSFDNLAIEPIPGTTEARNPVISPDGRSIAFAVFGRLDVLSLAGGPPRTLVEEGVPGGLGGIDWGNDGYLYFTDDRGALNRVPASGGATERLTTNEPGTTHSWGEALPDGRGVLFTIVHGTRPELSQIAVWRASSDGFSVLRDGTLARYAPSGFLLIVAADGSLLASRFDLDALELRGAAVGLDEEVVVYNGSATQLAWAGSGTLVYEEPMEPTVSSPVWVGRDGSERDVDPDLRVRLLDFTPMALSPDGLRLAFATEEDDSSVSLWVKELDLGPSFRLVSEGTHNYAPTWTPDGRFVSYVSNRRGVEEIWTQSVDGSGTPELVVGEVRGTFTTAGEIYEAAWTSDAAWIVYGVGANAIGDIFARPADPAESAIPLVVEEAYGEHSLALSPDNRWLAYVSNRSGANQVYVQRFPDPQSPIWPVSVNGGTEPLWSNAGDELFFRDPVQRLVAAQVVTADDFTVRSRRVLFSTAGYVRADVARRTYDIAPDDERFLFLRREGPEPVNRIVVIKDFIEVVQDRLGGG